MITVIMRLYRPQKFYEKQNYRNHGRGRRGGMVKLWKFRALTRDVDIQDDDVLAILLSPFSCRRWACPRWSVRQRTPAGPPRPRSGHGRGRPQRLAPGEQGDAAPALAPRGPPNPPSPRTNSDVRLSAMSRPVSASAVSDSGTISASVPLSQKPASRPRE